MKLGRENGQYLACVGQTNNCLLHKQDATHNTTI